MAGEMATVRLVAEIPKSALQMVQKGKARVSSHFIQSIDNNQIVNNFKIVGMDPTKPGNQVNKLLQNPLRRTAMKTAVNPSNLSLIKQNTDMILKSLNSLSTIQTLQWVNLGATLVNTAMTAVGFYLTLKKLDSIEGEIRGFINLYQSNRKDDMLEIYETHLHNMMNDLDYLQKRYQNKTLDDQYFKNRSRDIENECNQTAAFLKKVLKEFQEGVIDHSLGCQILFTLTPVLGEVITEYCWQYNSEIGGKHSQLDFGLDTLKQINSDQFKRFMKREMVFNPYYLAISPEQRQEAQTISFGCLSEMEENLKTCQEAIQIAPSHQLIPFDEFLDDRVYSNISKQSEETNRMSQEEFLTKQIMQMSVDDNDDVVYLPMQTAYV